MDYILAPDSSFVENVVKTIKGITGNMALIPCRPTLPSLQVILIDQFDEVRITLLFFFNR